MLLRSIFFIALLSTLPVLAAEDPFAGVTPEEKVKIENALPERAPAPVSEPRRLLVFTLNMREGERQMGHPSQARANCAFSLMGERTGAFEAFFSSDTAVFTAEGLEPYDAICFNNTAGVLFEDGERRECLLEYVYRGGGFIGIHAAAATFVQWPVYDQWPEFGQMLGGYENGGHPWKPHEWITLRVEEPEHPVNAAFDDLRFPVSDEVFQFQAPYSRDILRVLLTIDTEKTDMSPDRYILPERRADLDLAISWVRRYGRGRVFYTTLGHNPHIFWNRTILAHDLAGIQFALGDLAANTLPSNRLTPAARIREILGFKAALSPSRDSAASLFDRIENAAKMGCTYLSARYGERIRRGRPDRFDITITDSARVALRSTLVDFNIHLVALELGHIPEDPERIRSLFELARRMGVETVIGKPPPKTLCEIEKACRALGVRFAAEAGSMTEQQSTRVTSSSPRIMGFAVRTDRGGVSMPGSVLAMRLQGDDSGLDLSFLKRCKTSGLIFLIESGAQGGALERLRRLDGALSKLEED